MPRSSWKGYLKLSLVSCAVALYNASSSSERVSFNTLNRKTGNRLKQNMVDSVSGEPVDTADRVKGYQVSKGQYVMVEDTEIEALKIESTRTIEIETFVPQSEIDEIYLDSPYYLAPDDKVAEEAFAVIREAMTKRRWSASAASCWPARAHADAAAARQGHAGDDPALSLRGAPGRRDLRRDQRRRSCRPRCSTSPRRSSTACRATSSPTPSPTATRKPSSAMLRAKQAGQTFTVPEPPSPPTSSTSWTR